MLSLNDRPEQPHKPAPTGRRATQARMAMMAALLARMRQPHELTRLTLLLLVLASLRLRGYTLLEPEQPSRPGPSQPISQRRKGYNVKRPRTRFL